MMFAYSLWDGLCWAAITLLLVKVAQEDMKTGLIRNPYIISLLGLGLVWLVGYGVLNGAMDGTATAVWHTLAAVAYSIPLLALYWLKWWKAGDAKLGMALMFALPMEMPAVYLCAMPVALIAWWALLKGWKAETSSARLAPAFLICSILAAAVFFGL